MKAIVHIGAEKTGTSSIQHFCATNRAALAGAGVCYPACLGSPNQTHLAAYATDDHKIDEIRRDLGLFAPSDVPPFRRRVREALSREIGEAGRVSCLLFSNEHLQSRLVEESEVVRLRDLLREYTEDIRLVVYLRRQDRVAVSHYSTRLKAGGTGDDPIFPLVDDASALPRYYDYDTMLSLYERVFGIETITVRVFESEKITGDRLIADFIDTCDLPQADYVVDPAPRNRSLSQAGLAFFRRLNTAAPRFIEGRPNPRRREIAGIAGKHLVGAGPRADRAAAKAFQAHFQAGNRAVSERYFPQSSGPLFDDDFSAYDLHGDPAIDPDELIDFALLLWRERTEKLEEVRLGEALKRFHLIARGAIGRGDGAAPPELDDMAPAPTLPRQLLGRYLGALLYSQAYDRAAAAASEIAETAKAKALFVMVEAVALARGGNTAALDALIEAHSGASRLVRSMSALGREPFRSAGREGWIDLLRNGDGPQKDVYEKCLAWLT